MSEDRLTTDIDRGRRAQALLSDEMLAEAMENLHRSYVEAWLQTSVRDTDARERLWQAVQVVSKVKDHLVYVLNNGKLAQAELDKLNAADKVA